MNKIKMIIMRKIFITILGIITLWTPLKAQNNSRYYYAGDKVIIHNDFEVKLGGRLLIQ